MNIAPWVLEGSNGSLTVALTLALGFQLLFLFSVWRRDGCREVYLRHKAVLALCVAFGGLWLRAVDLWAQRFSENHGFEVPEWDHFSFGVHLAGTAMAVVGVLCWIRVTLPWGKDANPWAWLAFSALAFCVGFAPALV
jgi:hypothetical protein